MIEIINLTLGSYSDSGDIRNVIALRKLINKIPKSLELKLALALALIQDSIDQNNELGFKESLNIFSQLENMFLNKEDLTERYRFYFPIDPENLFLELHVWAISQYSAFLQNHERDDEAIYLLSNLKTQAGRNAQSLIQNEIKIIQHGLHLMKKFNTKDEEKFKQWVPVLVGLPFFISITGGLLASTHLTYVETASLIFVIALCVLLITFLLCFLDQTKINGFSCSPLQYY